MIGQTTLTNKIFAQIERGKFPRFSILIGEIGSGRRTLAYDIANKLGAFICEVGTKIDDIRTVVDNAYALNVKTVYLIPNAEALSVAAENVLLKVTEEPPKEAYFIITCETIDNLLPTIKSRGVTYMMEPYSYEEKCDFLESLDVDLPDDEMEFILNVSTNLGDIREFLEIDLSEFVSYINLVIDKIAEVSGSNAFKIGNQVALKDEEDKYNLRLFWRTFSSLCVDRMVDSENPLKYARGVAITGDSLQQLSIKGINKTMLFDSWVLSLRDEWYDDSGC